MNIHLFEKVAQEYTAEVSPNRVSQFLALINDLDFKGHETVLDIGCGPGPLFGSGSREDPSGQIDWYRFIR